MKEFITALIGKKCTISTLDESMDGTELILEAVSEHGLLCKDEAGSSVIINLEYITSVKEIPEKKKKEKK